MNRNPGAGRYLPERLLSLVKPYLGWMLLAALLGLLTIGSSIGLMALAAYILAAASLQPSIAELQVAIVGVRFFGISRGVFRYLERLVSHQTTFRLLSRFREWFYRGLEPAAPARLADLDSGELLSRITADLVTLEKFYLRVLAPPLIAVFTVVLSGILVGSFSIKLGVAFVLATVFTMAIVLFGYFRRRPAAQFQAERRGEIKSALIDQLQGTADLLVFNAERRYRAALEHSFEGLEEAGYRLASRLRFQRMLVGLLRDGTVLLVLALAVPAVRAGEIQGVYLGFLAMAAYASYEALLPLPDSLQQLDLSLQAAERLFHIVDLPPAVVEPESRVKAAGFSSLAFDRVGFHYVPEEDPVLQDITFEITPGKRMAVVGPSGSGKSTLLGLILRLWDADTGEIRLNGRLLKEYRSDEVRACFSVKPQRTFLFNAPVGSNLKLGAPQASIGEMRAAAHRAAIGVFLEGLPEGYDTWLGEGGANLSGGERQRLALARAYLKPGSILLLDEPTSSLDAVAENRVLERMLETGGEQALLLITHRLTGLEAMDEILVLSRGRIFERGTHGELLKLDGLYRSLWQAQHEAAALNYGLR
ncbi:MAG: thiol reductant ABC exporter subunit CydC [Anaerolineales bacterium]|nr:thiol reductant ABC exporter subunit CydC [Anaerolineales bacterium]